MAGIKIKISTEEAQTATKKLAADLEKLGATTKLTEKEITALQAKMLDKMATDKGSAAMNRLASSIGMTKSEVQKFQNQMVDPGVMGRMGQMASTMKAHWVGISIGIAAAGMAINKALEYMTEGAKASQAEKTFRDVAASMNESADRIVEAMDRASGRTVDDSDIMQKAVKGLMMGFSGDQLIKMMDMARLSARVTGEDVRTTYETITNSVAVNMPRALKQYGLITKEQMSLVNRAMAAGIEDIDLYKMAVANYNLQIAKSGDLSSNAAEGLQRVNREVGELKETLGKGLNALLQGLWGELQLVASAALYAAGGLAGLDIGRFEKRAKDREGKKTLTGEDEGAYWKRMAADAAKDRDAYFAAAENLTKLGKANLTGDDSGEKAVAKTAKEIAAMEKKQKAEEAALEAKIKRIETEKKALADRENMIKKLAADTDAAKLEASQYGLSDSEKTKKAMDAEVAEYRKGKMAEADIDKYIAAMQSLINLKKQKEDETLAQEKQEAHDKIMSLIAEESIFDEDENKRQINQIITTADEKIRAQKKELDKKKISAEDFAAYEIAVNRNKDAAILSQERENERRILDMKLSYLEDMEMEYSKEYRDLSILRIKKEAEDLETDFQNASGQGGMTQAQQNQLLAEQKLTEVMLTEWEERLRAHAAYLSAMGDDAGAKKALDAAKEMSDKKIELQERVAKHAINTQQTMFDKAAWIAKKIQDLDSDTMDRQIQHIGNKFEAEHKYQMDTIRGFGDVLDAAMSCYDEESYEYKRLAEWRKGLLIAELAMEAAKNVQIIAGLWARATASVAVAGIQNAANTSVALTGAAASVAAQGAVPGAGFAMAASMLAFMASVLGMAGIAFGGGGGSMGGSSTYSFSKRVLGAGAGEANTSIADTWELLQDTYDMEYRELSGIYEEMKDLNFNITGLVANIIRTGTYSGAGGKGSSTPGFAESLYQKSFADEFTKYSLNAMTLGLIKLGDWADNLIGSSINKVFGGEVTAKVSQAGISISPDTISDILANGIDAQKYTQIKYTKDGGWFGKSSSRNTTKYDDLDIEVQNTLNKVFGNIGNTLVYYAEQLGTDVNAVLNYQIQETKLNLKNKSAEEINEILTDYFSNLADDAMSALFGEMVSAYQQVGEGLSETTARLIVDKIVVAETLDKIGQSFVGTIDETIAFSEAIITLAGDLETLVDATSTYYDKFFSDAEKQAEYQSQLTEALIDMNLVLPESRAGYRALIEALGLSQEKGMEAQVELLKLSEIADEYYAYLEDATNEAIDKQKEYIETLKDVSKTIDDWLANLSISNLAPVQSEATWTSQYSGFLTKAKAPTATSEDVQTYLNFATQYLEFQKNYGTERNYKAIYDAVVADVTNLGNVKDVQLQVAEQQLEVLKQIQENTSNYSLSGSIAAQRALLPDLMAPIRESYLKQLKGGSYNWGVISKMIDEALGQLAMSPEALGLPAGNFDIFRQYVGYAEGGSFDGGWRVVGERGPELEYTGPSLIYSNKDSRALLDPDQIGKAIAKHINKANVSSPPTVQANVIIDRKVLLRVVADGFYTDDNLKKSVRKTMNQ